MLAPRVLVLSLGACAYQPGSFVDSNGPFVGARVTIDCLDLAIERRPDLRDGSKVMEFAFGNRCDQPTPVDLSSARIVGRKREGADVSLVAFDPKRELRPLLLDGRAVGRESIAYAAADDLTSVCVDAATIAHASGPRWVCTP